MFFQIEITTACNFRCFYCIGRTWKPRHMTWELFESVIEQLPRGRHIVSLQGEGEPLAHPRFWQMLGRVLALGYQPYLITNCSFPRTPELAKYVPTVGVSLDTLDREEADSIGRFRLDRVLANFEALLALAGPSRIVVHTVDFGQDRTALDDYLRRHGVKQQIVQPLQTKEDYRQRYVHRVQAVPASLSPGACANLLQPRMRFFNIDGISMPCSYIKDASRYESTARLRADFAEGKVPDACRGCRELRSRVR